MAWLHLALTSRSDPPLALALLRARGQLTELRAAELRFTTDEAAALLQVPEAVAAALAARTEGAVTGRPGSQALLEEAERAGLFVVPLDEVRGWWRYHHLFADLLRARLQQQQPTRIPALHRKAALR